MMLKSSLNLKLLTLFCSIIIWPSSEVAGQSNTVCRPDPMCLELMTMIGKHRHGNLKKTQVEKFYADLVNREKDEETPPPSIEEWIENVVFRNVEDCAAQLPDVGATRVPTGEEIGNFKTWFLRTERDSKDSEVETVENVGADKTTTVSTVPTTTRQQITKVDNVPGRISGINVSTNCNYDGHDFTNLESSDLTACARMCFGHSECTHFTWVPATYYNRARCYLKQANTREEILKSYKTSNEASCGIIESKFTSLVPDNGINSGVKHATTVPGVANLTDYYFHANGLSCYAAKPELPTPTKIRLPFAIEIGHTLRIFGDVDHRTKFIDIKLIEDKPINPAFLKIHLVFGNNPQNSYAHMHNGIQWFNRLPVKFAYGEYRRIWLSILRRTANEYSIMVNNQELNIKAPSDHEFRIVNTFFKDGSGKLTILCYS